MDVICSKWVVTKMDGESRTLTQKCLDFYNWRRKKLAEVELNDAHRMIAELEKEHELTLE